MADQSFQLVVRKGPRPGQAFPLTMETITIGRDPMTDIVVNDPEVSRHHAKLTRTAGAYQIQDMGSTNGTFVDGKRLGGEAAGLSQGQLIMVGSNVTMVFLATSTADPMATMIAPAGMGEMPLPASMSEEAEEEEPEAEMPSLEPVMPAPVLAAEAEEPEPAEFDASSTAAYAEMKPAAAPEPAGLEAWPALDEPEPLPSFDEPEPLPTYDEPAPLPSFDEPEPLPSFDEPEPLPAFEGAGRARAYDDAEPLPSFESPPSGPTFDSGREPLPAFDAGSTPPARPPAKSGPMSGRNRNIIIVVVAVVLLCCCCAIVVGVLTQTEFGQELISMAQGAFIALAAPDSGGPL